MNLSKHLTIDEDFISSPNLCDRLSDQDLDTIGDAVWQDYDMDKLSRANWEKRNEAALDLAMQISKEKNFPWPGCANVIFPLVTIAALQFSARSYPNIIQGTNVVRYRVLTGQDQGVVDRATRVGKHMSWQVLEEDDAWEEQHDRLLLVLAICGSAFIKTYFSGSLGHNVSQLVLPRDLVVDYYATSIESAARKTHCFTISRNDIYERVKQNVYRNVLQKEWYDSNAAQRERTQSDIRLGKVAPQPSASTPFRFLEQHRTLDLDGDGYEEPYIVTIEEASKCVVRIRPRFTAKGVVRSEKEIVSIRATEYFTKYSFIPSPDGGIYDLGFGTFLGPINEAVSTAIDQLLDMGTLQNSIGGFLGRGAKIRGGQYTMAPWEWKRVDSTGDDLRKNLVPFPEKKPLDVTFQLLSLLINYADRIAGTTDIMVGENPGQNTPAETSRNMTEQGMRVYSMIFKRVWRSMKEEFKKLYRLNSMFLVEEMPFGSGKDLIRREDYKGTADYIAPVANPNITSTAMKTSQAVMVKQSSMTTAGYDKDQVERNFLSSIEVENIDVLYPGMEKTGPLPNPKLQVEQMKAQVQQMKIKAEQMRWANELLADRPKIQAEIDKLKAETVVLIASIGAEQAASQIKVFESLISAWETKSKMDNDRLKMLLDSIQGKGDEKGNEGGVPGLEGPTNNPGGPPGLPGGMGAKPNGAMGSGTVPG